MTLCYQSNLSIVLYTYVYTICECAKRGSCCYLTIEPYNVHHKNLYNKKLHHVCNIVCRLMYIIYGSYNTCVRIRIVLCHNNEDAVMSLTCLSISDEIKMCGYVVETSLQFLHVVFFPVMSPATNTHNIHNLKYIILVYYTRVYVCV